MSSPNTSNICHGCEQRLRSTPNTAGYNYAAAEGAFDCYCNTSQKSVAPICHGCEQRLRSTPNTASYNYAAAEGAFDCYCKSI